MTTDERPNRLPANLHQQYLPQLSRAYFLGLPISELSRDDLLVMAMMGWEQARAAQDRCERDIEMLNRWVKS